MKKLLSGTNRKWWIVALSLLVLCVVGVIVFLLFSNDKDAPGTSNIGNTNTVGSLNSATPSNGYISPSAALETPKQSTTPSVASAPPAGSYPAPTGTNGGYLVID